MDPGAIPEQEQRRTKMAGELFQEAQHRHRVEIRIDQQLKVQAHFAPVGTDTQGGNSRDLFEVATNLPEHRSLSAPAPGPPYYRQQEQPALIDENQPSAQMPGFFLIRGHSRLIQR